MTPSWQRRCRGCVAALLAVFSSVSLANTDSPACLVSENGPSIGLALSGGGARGSAHVGVLKVLQDLRIPVHCIAGTSLGSVVGALYAIGKDAEEIEQLLGEVDWNRGFVDEFPRERLVMHKKEEQDRFLIPFELGVSERSINLPLGVVQGHSLHLLLKELVGGAALVQNFDQMPIPFRAIATDLETAQRVDLASGDLASALQASMAIPGVYTPVRIGDRLLVDGGVAENLPVATLREMGADIIIAVDIGTPLAERAQLQSVVSILDQLTNVITQKNVASAKDLLTDEDILITPKLGEYTATDFALAGEIVILGEQAAQAHSRQLQDLALTAVGYDAYRQSLVAVPPLPSEIAAVTLIQSSALPTRVLRERIRWRDDTAFDMSVLHQSLDALQGLGLYERVGYLFYPTDEGTAIQINAEPKSWGPDILRFGFSLEDDFSGNNSFGLSAGYRRHAVNAAGGEFRARGEIGETPGLALEFFQPFSALGSSYLLASYTHRQFSQGAFDESTQTAEYRARRNLLGFFIGREFAHHSDLRFGVALATGRIKRRVGDDELTDRQEFDEGALVARYRYDTLDSIEFPADGRRLDVVLESSLDALGADRAFDAVSIDALSVHRFGDYRLLGAITLQSATRNDLPLQKQFSRGGLLNTSGFSENLEVGQYAGHVGLALYRPLQSSRIEALDYPVYVGATVDAGGAFAEREDIALDELTPAARLFIGARTPLGPVILGVGGARGQGLDALLALGVTF